MVGIESLAFYTPGYYLDLQLLARVRGVDPDKYTLGIGQEKMAIVPPDEDVVTMGAHAASDALQGIDRSTIDTLMFATESGVDQSKAAAIYAHQLLGLPSTCKAFEIKQACCGSTAALHMAQALVHQHPTKRVLIIASDVARYGVGTSGEPTQGAGAIAMVISATPRLFIFDPESGSFTEDVMDFWRPNYMEEALVDGKYSIKIYLKALTESWTEYHRQSGRQYGDCDRYCFHLPFTKMADKANLHLAHISGHRDEDPRRLRLRHEDSLHYNRICGNCYTASLYVGLASLLEQCRDDLTGCRIGMFSYGSGCMASFFSGVVCVGYRQALRTKAHEKMLRGRRELTYAEYESFFSHRLPTDGSDYAIDRYTEGPYRLAGIQGHKRLYEMVVSDIEHGIPEHTELVV